MLVLTLLVVLPVLVTSQCITGDDKKGLNTTEAITLVEGQRKFSLDILKTLMDEYKDKNMFLSPHSLYQSLILAYIAAANETEAEIQRGLNIPDNESKLAIIRAYGTEKFLQNMREAKGAIDYEFKSANKMYLSNKLTTKECMKHLLKDELSEIDFETDPNAARKEINTWVEEQTKRHITELLPPDAIDSSSKLIMVNAAYFKGLWKSKFLPELTKKNDLFYIRPDHYGFVDMMRQKGSFNHMADETIQAHIIELPYKGDDISMFVLLPRFELNAIEKMIEKLTFEKLEEILSGDGFIMRPVEILIPKFSVEASVNLVPVFERLGLGEIFNDTADFSTLTGDSEIHFNDGIHKAKLEVDEKGTVAAAATAIFTFRSSRPLEQTKFQANHPFLYIIYDKVSKNILFQGVYRIPDKKYPKSKKT